MKKLLLLSLPLVLLAAVAEARTTDCLQQVDGMIVEYALPPSPEMVGSQAIMGYGTQAEPQPSRVGPVEASPRGRPGYRSLVEQQAGRAGTANRAPPLIEPKISGAKRAQLESLLHQARAAEALGDEPKCLSVLEEARKIVASK